MLDVVRFACCVKACFSFSSLAVQIYQHQKPRRRKGGGTLEISTRSAGLYSGLHYISCFPGGISQCKLFLFLVVARSLCYPPFDSHFACTFPRVCPGHLLSFLTLLRYIYLYNSPKMAVYLFHISSCNVVTLGYGSAVFGASCWLCIGGSVQHKDVTLSYFFVFWGSF